jgi:Transposase DDE domain
LGASSLKAALDLDWDDPASLEQALTVVLGAVGRVEGLAAELGGADDPQVAQGLAAARQVRDQDTVVGRDGVTQIRQGVARDRRISIEDPQMRHGRKTKSVRIDGYKRHVLTDLDTDLVPAVGVTAANVAEATVAGQITADLDAQQVSLGELHIDRAYLSSRLVQDRDEDLRVFCKAFPVRNGPRFAKPAFTLDFDQGLLTCPNSVTMPFAPGGKVGVPRPGLPGLPAAHPVHHQHPRPQRADPPRRAAAGRAPRRAANPTRASQAARAGQGRAHPGPCGPLAGPACPLHRRPQEPVRPAPGGGRP